MSLKNVSRVTAWLFLSAIVVLTVVPPGSRPVTFVPHKIEHAAIFMAAKILFGTFWAASFWGHFSLLLLL
jgi:hypothetical protein